MLVVENLFTYHGELLALKGVSLTLEQGETVAVLGANGAGKSTLLGTISGLLRPRSGKITFMENEITGVPTHKIVAKGLSLVPEGRQLFTSLTVLQNLRLGMYHWQSRDSEAKEELEKVYSLFPILRERSRQLAGTLSGGQQQMLAIARALVGRPKLLLLDEPSLGLAPLIVEEIFSILLNLNRTGISILLVEQNVPLALDIAHRCYVLQSGNIVLDRDSSSIRNDGKIMDAYLGGRL